MNKFYNNFTFILAFSIFTIAVNMMMGAKFTERFLLLVLLSMIVLNAEKIEGISKNLNGGVTE